MKKILSTLSRKWPEYLIEGTVIVASILGAFALDNWNQTRRAQDREIKFYKELSTDLKANRLEIKEVDDALSNTIKSINGIHHYLTTQKPVDDSLKAHFEGIYSLGVFNSPNSAYQNMQNSGAFELSNDSLRIKITDVYELDFFNIHFRNDEQWEMIKQSLRPFMIKHFKQTESVTDHVFYQGLMSLNEPINYPQLCQNIEFQNIYLNLKFWCNLRTYRLNETKSKLDLLIEEIDMEIERLSK